MNNRYSAFTLAEVLITLGVIGVVTAITMPTIIANINERVNSERQANIALKVTQGMEKMKAMGKLNEHYESTEAFVEELQNHLKITKKCDKDHLADCWPTQTVTAGDGEEYNVSEFKTGKSLGLFTSTDNVGIVLADGGAFIINYDPNTKGLDVGDRVTAYSKSLPVGGGKSKEMPYSSNVTSAVDFVMDVNGGKGPNRETIDNKYGDIRSFTAATFSGCGGFKIPGLGCVINIGLNYEPQVINSTISYYEPPVMKCVMDAQGNMFCTESGGWNTTPFSYEDYYLGAKNKCENMNGMHLASANELSTINNYVGKISGAPAPGESFMSSNKADCPSVAGGYSYPCYQEVILEGTHTIGNGISASMGIIPTKVTSQVKAICIE